MADIKTPGDDEEDARRAAAEPATEDYTGEPCVQCGRIRVFLRRDGQRQCEKCETIQPELSHVHRWFDSRQIFVGTLYPSIYPYACQCGALRKADGEITPSSQRVVSEDTEVDNT